MQKREELEMEKLKLRSVDERKEIHSDLVADILTRLDAKTLSNCRRVCKTWYRIISDPIFIAARRKFMLRNSNLLFVDIWKTNSGEREKNFGECIRTFSICDHNLIDREEGDYLLTSMTSTILFRRTTCDLLCYMGIDQCVYLYNPRTDEVHTLPACPRFEAIATYGYVASTQEYIVVAYTTGAAAAGGDLSQNNSVSFMKFSLTSSSSVSSLSWKEIDVGFPQRVTPYGEILINNHVYWGMGCLEITSLDLEKKMFGIIKCPEEFCLNAKPIGLRNTRMIDFEGRLCLVDLDFLEESKELIVWEFSAKTDSWMKKYHIKPDFQFSIYDVHPKSKEGDLMLFGYRKSDKKEKFIMFNVETKRVKPIKSPYSRGTIKDLQPPIGQIRHLHRQQVSFLW